MPKKLRRRRDKRRARGGPQRLVKREAGPLPQGLSPSLKQTPVAKSPMVITQETNRYVLSDIRRTAIIAGAIFIILIVLYFLLR
jgi:hypothetical protein